MRYKYYDKFRRGEYKMPPPPTCHLGWGEDRWIEYITLYGVWL